MDRNGMRPIHPGEVLNKEFMDPLGMTVMDLAMPTNWPESEIEKLVKCQLRICADLAISLATHLDTTDLVGEPFAQGSVFGAVVVDE